MTGFTSSLYLGMKHSSSDLKGWEQLTTGAPAILNEPATAKRVAAALARMQGNEAGIAAPSTLHLYTDLYELLAQKNTVLFIDEKIYPVSAYGIEKVLLRGIRVIKFRHQDAVQLSTLLKAYTGSAVMPVIITDGWCPVCGKPAPVHAYAAMAKRYNGWVVIDDTQSFGILGERNDSSTPYGKGGGGLLRWLQVKETNIITIVSLAKGFGAPLAVMSGPESLLREVKDKSKTRVHSSPVSIAHLQAAANALHINRQQGDQLRRKLWTMVSLFKNAMKTKGMVTTGGIFPVQHVQCREAAQTIRLWERLRQKGIDTVLLTLHGERRPAVTFILRSDHTAEEITELAVSMKPEKYKRIY